MKEDNELDELIDKFWKMTPFESIEWGKEHSLETVRMLWYLIGYCGKLKEKEKRETMEIPLPLALTIMSIVSDICIQDKLDEKPYLTSEKLVRDEFFKLLEPYRTGGD